MAYEKGLVSLNKRFLKRDLGRRCKGEADNFPRGNNSNTHEKSLLNALKINFCHDGGQTPGWGSREVVGSNPWKYLKLSWPCSVHGFGQETSRRPVLSL